MDATERDALIDDALDRLAAMIEQARRLGHEGKSGESLSVMARLTMHLNVALLREMPQEAVPHYIAQMLEAAFGPNSVQVIREEHPLEGHA